MRTTVSIQAFATREPPVFDTKEAERRHVQERLAAACRILGRRGLSEGLLGHITVRDPVRPDCFWVNPIGIPMHRVKVSQLVLVDHQGRVVHGDGAVNPVGLLLHTALHRARPDVGRYATPMHLPHRPGLLSNACSTPLRKMPASFMASKP